MAGIYELLERDFKKKYPHRNEPTRKGRLKIQEKDGSFTYKDYEVPNHFDFWYHWTDGYIEFLTTHNYKFLEWLSNDTERVGALEEIKKEVEHRLPPRYPHKAEILEFVEWKIKQILDLQASAKTGATTFPKGLPEEFEGDDIKRALEKAIKAGYLDENYQPIGDLIHKVGVHKGKPYKTRLAAFATAFCQKVSFGISYPAFQRLWHLDTGQLYGSQTNSQDYMKYFRIFEKLFKKK